MKTSDGLELLVQSWRPLDGTKGTLIIVHGLKDYADRYVEFAHAAARRGYAGTVTRREIGCGSIASTSTSPISVTPGDGYPLTPTVLATAP